MQSQSKGDGADGGQLPTWYLLMRREVLAIEMRKFEDVLMERKAINRRLVAKARRRDG